MKLTKGRLSKLYRKTNQSKRRFKKNKKRPVLRNTFRKRRPFDLNRKTLKRMRGGQDKTPPGDDEKPDEIKGPEKITTENDPLANHTPEKAGPTLNVTPEMSKTTIKEKGPITPVPFNIEGNHVPDVETVTTTETTKKEETHTPDEVKHVPDEKTVTTETIEKVKTPTPDEVKHVTEEVKTITKEIPTDVVGNSDETNSVPVQAEPIKKDTNQTEIDNIQKEYTQKIEEAGKELTEKLLAIAAKNVADVAHQSSLAATTAVASKIANTSISPST